VHQPAASVVELAARTSTSGRFASRESAQCTVAIGIDTTVSTSPRSPTPLPHHAVLHVEHELALRSHSVILVRVATEYALGPVCGAAAAPIAGIKTWRNMT